MWKMFTVIFVNNNTYHKNIIITYNFMKFIKCFMVLQRNYVVIYKKMYLCSVFRKCYNDNRYFI